MFRTPTSLPWFWLLCCVPLGIALQNVLLVLLGLWLGSLWLGSLWLGSLWLGSLWLRDLCLKAPSHPPPVAFPLSTWLWGSALAMHGCFLLGTYTSTPPRSVDWGTHLGGHLVWMGLPACMLALHRRGLLCLPPWQKLAQWANVLAFLWGILALSQYVCGWRILGIHVVSDVPRPRGLYSHPLSLAYGAFFFWPFMVNQLLARPRVWLHWAGFLGIGCILWLTLSRAIQAMAFCTLLGSIWMAGRGTQRWVWLAILAVGSGSVLLTDNLISRKFWWTFTQEGVAKESSYPDDRVAFWHAHSEMIFEKPWIGHGYGLDQAFRKPYYERLGLGEFDKPYEAHNQYIQVWAQGGVGGLFFFLLWWLNCFRLIQQIPHVWSRRAALQTLLGFMAALLLQNALNDASIRLVWALCTGLVLMGAYSACVGAPKSRI